MKHLKIFESYGQNDELEELAEMLPYDYVDEYYQKNYSLDASEISNFVDLWKLVDDDKVVQDFIDGYVEGAEIDEFDYLKADEYEHFIRYEMLQTNTMEEYLEKQRKKLKIEGSDRDVFDQIDISKKKMIKLIKRAGYEREFIEEHYKEIYDNSSAYDMFSELYGEDDLKENAYKYLQNYLDDDDIIEEYKKNESDEYKREYLRDNIDTSSEIQEKIFEAEPEKSVKLLFDIIDASRESIGDTYDFQEAYLNVKIQELKETYGEGEGDIPDTEIPEIIKEINDKFGLADELREEYKEYIWLIDSEKYNL